MSHSRSIDIREVVFIGSAGDDFDSLPKDVLEESRTLISQVQNDLIPEGNKFERLGGQLRGVAELRIDGKDTNTYRVYHVMVHREVIYVLDARAKKSPKGNEIPKPDVERILARKKTADNDYKNNVNEYKRSFRERDIRRNVVIALNASRKPKGA